MKIIKQPTKRIRISDYLDVGLENARTAEELASILNISTRIVAEMIHKERLEGAPICASQKRPYGFFLAAGSIDINNYCLSLDSRIRELTEVRDIMCELL